MLTSKQPLEEELALLWHNHFATNASDIAGDTGDPSSMMLDQHGLFRGYGLADGNFAELARGIIRDPAMLTYLNNDVNVKAHPNENFSRELMELFTLGEGRYSEHDVKQGARALTGYGVKDRAFHFELNDHDLNQKSILGRTGRFNGEDFVQILLEQDACALFIAQRLYRHFVADTFEDEDRDAAAVIAALAQVLRANGYQLGPALQALFRSEHFFAPFNRGRKIKSTAQLIAGPARMLGTPRRDLSVIVGEMAIMGQRLFHPPSVAGWEGGRSWLTPSTLMARQNVCIYLITGVLPAGVLASQHVGIDPLTGGMDTARAGYDPSVLLKSVDHVTPQAAVDHLTQRLLAVPCDRRERAALTAYLVHRGGQVTGDDLLGLLVLITALPAYQLC